MKSITRLFGAFGTMADSIYTLASVIDVITARLRQQLALDEAGPVLEHEPSTAEIPQLDPEPAPSAKRGKKSA